MQPRLRAFLRYHGFDTYSSEDIAADIAEKTLAQLGTLRRARTFEAWFWVIARRQVVDHLRATNRAVYEPVHCDPVPPDETAVAADETVMIRRALSRLNESDRTLLWLREVEGLDYKAIGKRLEMKPATVRVRNHRARNRLEAAYEELSAGRETASNMPGVWKVATAQQ
jgi:RNA polymerase sigma-70 factor (ECF subfamily)